MKTRILLERTFLGLSILAWVVAMCFMVDEAHAPTGLTLMLIGLPVFLVGMLFFTARHAGARIALGLGVFLALLTGAIMLTSLDGIAAVVGSLLIPGSILLFMAWVYWFTVGRDARQSRRLARSGARVPAIVRGFVQTGVQIERSGDFPRYGVELQVEVALAAGAEGGAPVFAKARLMLAEHELASLRNGQRIWVRCDPKAPAWVAIDSWEG